jgi:hypothetical protein
MSCLRRATDLRVPRTEEYMENPFGCGNPACSSRFCRPCLHRVLRESSSSAAIAASDGRSSGSDPPPPPDSARCPNCRSRFTARSMSADPGLRDEMRDCDASATCPHRGCGATLRLTDLAAHEAACPRARAGCRYADWGCGWVGVRSDLPGHDATECEFRGGLGALAERFRRHDEFARRAVHMHHARIGAMGGMLALHSRQLMSARARNPWNPLDVLWLTYQAALFPGRSAMRGAQREVKAIISNVLLLLPSLALAFNVSGRDRMRRTEDCDGGNERCGLADISSSLRAVYYFRCLAMIGGIPRPETVFQYANQYAVR